MKSKRMTIAAIFLLLIWLTGCTGDKLDEYVYNDEYLQDGNVAEPDSGISSGEVIAYGYPDKPPQALKEALEKTAQIENADFTVGEINVYSDIYGTSREIPIYWRGEHTHSTLISFYTPDVAVAGYSRATRNDVSFTIAFQDPEAMEDMITLAIPVIQYANPALSWDNALAMAEYLLNTLTVDGYGNPVDIGGYQFQLHYTNPLVFFSSNGFVANMGLKVQALGSIWGDFDTSGYPEMTPSIYSAAGNGGNPAKVRVTGVITEWYKKPDYYGTPETFVTVEYSDASTCLLRLNHLNTPYELALGGRYEFFVMLNHPRGPALIYAIQLGLPG